MQQWWRRLGVQLGKQWKLVLAAVVVITAVLAVGFTQVEFATGQDSYLNEDSQEAIDNVEFQNNFGGENIVMMFIAEDGYDVTDLYEGDNLAELERLRDELHEVPEAFAVVDPLTTLSFSHNLLYGGAEGVAGGALLGAMGQEEEGSDEAAARSADVTTSLARVGAIDESDMEIGNPAWNEMLIFDNTGFTVDEDGTPVPPDNLEDMDIRKSLRGVFPNFTGDPHTHVVSGIVLEPNADLDTLSSGTENVLEVLETVEFEGFELTSAGSPIYLKEINDYLQGGMLTLGAAALVVMAIVLLIMFRVRWRLLSLLAVLIGVAWAFALMGYIGLDLSLVTISGLPILIGLGIDFAIQIHNRVEEEVVIAKDEHPMSETLANVAPALVVATIAAAIAFLAMQVSQVPMIRDFGVLLAIGVGVLLIVGIIVPTAALGIREYSAPTEERKVSIVERITVTLGSLPAKLGAVFVAVAILLFTVGVLVEGDMEIESDPLKWIDQDSEAVTDVRYLEDETGFSTTMGVLVTANNIADQDVVNVLDQFIKDAEARDEVVASSALVSTMSKIIDIDGATPVPPRAEDIVGAAEVANPSDELLAERPGLLPIEDIQRALFLEDLTATQVNLRLAPASLDERAVLVEQLQDDLDRLIDGANIEEGSVLLDDLSDGQPAIHATPAGLAVVGTGLLENLSANRAVLTYLALGVVALWLVLRFRSLTRTLVTLVPVFLAVGASSIIVGETCITRSPMTTVSGPLVTATCAEFSILIMARYLEERQRGLDPGAASHRAAGRTGRAFFTSAATTIGGFAVLIGSALPLLRNFGLIVTLNVAIALLAALVVMPPLVQWVDAKGWLATEGADGAVRLAAPPRRSQLVGTAIGVVVIAAALGGVIAAADTSSGTAEAYQYTPVDLPVEEAGGAGEGDEPAGGESGEGTPEEGEEPGEGQEPGDDGQDAGGEPGGEEAAPEVDPSQFGDELTGEIADATVAPILFRTLVNDHGVAPNVAVCAAETLYDRVPTIDTQAAQLLQWTEEALAPVIDAAMACGVDQATIDAVIAAGPPI